MDAADRGHPFASPCVHLRAYIRLRSHFTTELFGLVGLLMRSIELQLKPLSSAIVSMLNLFVITATKVLM